MSTGLIFRSADNRSRRSLACCSTAMTKASWTWLFSASSLAVNKQTNIQVNKRSKIRSKTWFFRNVTIVFSKYLFLGSQLFIINNFFGGTPNAHVNVRFTTRSTPYKLYEIFLLLRNFVSQPAVNFIKKVKAAKTYVRTKNSYV